MLRIHKEAAGEPLLFPPSSPPKQVNLASGTGCLHTTCQNHALHCASQWKPMSPCCHLHGGSVFRVPPVRFSASDSGRKSWPGKSFQCGVPFHSNLTTPPSINRGEELSVPSLTFAEGHAPVSTQTRPEMQARRQPWLDQHRLTRGQEILPGLLTFWTSASFDAGH